MYRHCITEHYTLFCIFFYTYRTPNLLSAVKEQRSETEVSLIPNIATERVPGLGRVGNQRSNENGEFGGAGEGWGDGGLFCLTVEASWLTLPCVSSPPAHRLDPQRAQTRGENPGPDLLQTGADTEGVRG